MEVTTAVQLLAYTVANLSGTAIEDRSPCPEVESIISASVGNVSMNDTTEAISAYRSIIRGREGYLVWGVLGVALVLIGDVLNTLSIAVLTRSSMAGPLSTLLTGLAVCDILAPTFWAMTMIQLYHLDLQFGHSFTYVRLSNWMTPLLGMSTIFTICSNWLIVTVAIFRFIAVSRPLHSYRYCTVQRARIAILLTLFLSILVYMPALVILKVEQFCHGSEPYLGIATRSNLINQKMYIPILSAISYYIPWLICFIFSTLLVIKFRQHSISDRQLHNDEQSVVINRRTTDHQRKLTLMTILISAVYLICQFPSFFLIAQKALSPEKADEYGWLFARTYLINTIMLIINHSVNFFIYSVTNTLFRQTLRAMCMCHYHGRRRRSLMGNTAVCSSVPSGRYIGLNNMAKREKRTPNIAESGDLNTSSKTTSLIKSDSALDEANFD